MATQTDGSTSAFVRGTCDNSCSGVLFASQTFTPSISGTLGSLEVFTSGFSTNSSNPDANNCYIWLYDDTGALISGSDGVFTGYSCAGDLLFTFKNEHPFLTAGKTYRWQFMFGTQNYTGLTFYGSATDTISGSFSLPPIADAKFTMLAAIDPPSSLEAIDRDASGTALAILPENGFTKGTAVMLGATLPGTSSDVLQLQVEVEPSSTPFTGIPNETSTFAGGGSSSSVAFDTTQVTPGGYHWQARAADAIGNASPWATPSDPSLPVDFFVGIAAPPSTASTDASNTDEAADDASPAPTNENTPAQDVEGPIIYVPAGNPAVKVSITEGTTTSSSSAAATTPTTTTPTRCKVRS
jgi:hypothetical protein